MGLSGWLGSRYPIKVAICAPSYYVRVQMVVLNELFVKSQIRLHNRIRVTQSEIAYTNISF